MCVVSVWSEHVDCMCGLYVRDMRGLPTIYVCGLCLCVVCTCGLCMCVVYTIIIIIIINRFV